jgi:hypothetical protein
MLREARVRWGTRWRDVARVVSPASADRHRQRATERVLIDRSGGDVACRVPFVTQTHGVVLFVSRLHVPTQQQEGSNAFPARKAS